MKVTMTSDQIFDAIESIAATKGKNDKISMIGKLIESSEFESVLIAALDPLTTYGVRKIPEKAANSTVEEREFNDQTWQALKDLASRALSGNAAIQAIQSEMEALTQKSAELFKRIILKDLKADFGDSSVNKAKSGTIQTFPYMRCSLPKDTDFDEWDWAAGVISQEKADGMFANIDHEVGGNVFIKSRQGSVFPMEHFEQLAKDIVIATEEGMQNHGEIVVMRDGQVLPREIGNGILTSVLKGGSFGPNEMPKFLIWDSIPLSEVKPKARYKARGYKERLFGIVRKMKNSPTISVAVIPTLIVHSLEDAYKHYADLLAVGKEGTVIKKGTAIWGDYTSKEQIKLKLEFDVDLEVIAVEAADANSKNAGRSGALLCKTSDDKLFVSVAIKNEKMRDEVDANPDDWISKITTVRSNAIMKPSQSNENYSLFLPRMVEAVYRTDKSVADSLLQVFAQEEAAKSGAAIVLKKAA